MSGLAFDHREKDKTSHKGDGLIQDEKEHRKKGKGNTRVDSSKGKHPERDHCAHTQRITFSKRSSHSLRAVEGMTTNVERKMGRQRTQQKRQTQKGVRKQTNKQHAAVQHKGDAQTHLQATKKQQHTHTHTNVRGPTFSRFSLSFFGFSWTFSYGARKKAKPRSSPRLLQCKREMTPFSYCG